MIKTESSIEIQKPIDEVYKIAESYPRFVSFFHKREVVESTDRSLSVRVGMKRFGVNFEWEGEGQKEPARAIRFTQTKGLLKGMKANWFFDSEDNKKTKVSIKTSFEFKIPAIGFILEKSFSTFLVERTTQKILNELKKSSESG